MSAKTKQRLIGLLILVVATGMFTFNWYSALTKGVYWEKASIAFPFFAFLGLAIFLFPITKEECLEKYGSEQLGWENMRIEQKLIIITGVISGVLNWALISGRI